MSANVEPHEAQAILDAVEPATRRGSGAGVQTRDFGRPLRLSGRALEELRARVQGVLGECEGVLSRALRGEHTLALTELGEECVEGLFDELAEPFALVRFDVGGQPAWARWEIAGALAAVEVTLGAAAPSEVERSPSAVERRILLRLLETLVTRIGSALGLEVGAGQVIETPEEAGSWADGGPGADRARLRLHLSFDGPGAPSGIDLWLPGIAGESLQLPDLPRDLPGHLGPVSIVLSARLGARDVPLAELLAIEEGDVIPLDTPADGLLEVLAEDLPCARALLGCSQGRLALRIAAVGAPTDDET